MSNKNISNKKYFFVYSEKKILFPAGGASSGTCAKGYGVCCVCKLFKNGQMLEVKNILGVLFSSCLKICQMY